ncbi:MAG: IMP dehydrogenase [Lentisphaeria bacterium]|nr:IMP dehydrogenase [Lentisphaeria bacterium]
MEAMAFEALTFDDISLLTLYSDFAPSEADIGSKFSRNIPLKVPLVSAAMDTVTESRMAIAMALAGGIGVIHKNLSTVQQAAEVVKVKHYLNGLIEKPVVFRDDMLVSDVMNAKSEENYTFSGFPILDTHGKLVGLLTARDVKFLTDYSMKVSDAMSRKLVVGKPGTTMAEAFDIMVENKVGKLPILADDGSLLGLYSFQDVRTLAENISPEFNRDARHQLRVAAAIGPFDEERTEVLVAAGVDALVIDTAHGHSKNVLDTVKLLKKQYDGVDVVAGNVGTGEAARALADAGVDGVKVGVGPGSICTTRIVAGVGVPQVTAIYRAAKAVDGEVPIIADGGIAHSGAIAKALAVGGSCVMMGSLLAGTEESPGERILHQGRTFVVYRGMGSLEAMKTGKGSRERYAQGDIEEAAKLVPQGIEGMIPYRGRVAEVLHQYAGGLRFSLGYCGSRTIHELQTKAQLVKVTAAGRQEAHPHDVKAIKDAPNYRAT